MSDSSSKNNLPQYPESEFKDEFSKWMKSAVGDILPFGNTVTSIFSSFVTPKLEERREEFLRDIAYWIMKLNRQIKEFSPEKLMKNDVFISSLLNAVQIAQRNTDKMKVEFLRNATLNSVLEKEYTDFEKLQMIRIIEDITGLHYLVLKFFEGSESGTKALTHHLRDFVNLNRNKQSLSIDSFLLVLNDLVKNFLLYKKGENLWEGTEHFCFGQTHLGKNLIKYISNPIIQE